MSATKAYEVKFQTKGGGTQVTIIYSDSEHKVKQLLKMQFGDAVVSVHYIRPL